MYNPIVRICNRYLIGSSGTCDILGFDRELWFEGSGFNSEALCVLNTVEEFLGGYYQCGNY